MTIKTDLEGKKAIDMLCDLGLKASGVQNLQLVINILQAVEIVEEKPEKVEK